TIHQSVTSGSGNLQVGRDLNVIPRQPPRKVPTGPERDQAIGLLKAVEPKPEFEILVEDRIREASDFARDLNDLLIAAGWDNANKPVQPVTSWTEPGEVPGQGVEIRRNSGRPKG